MLQQTSFSSGTESAIVLTEDVDIRYLNSTSMAHSCLLLIASVKIGDYLNALPNS